MCLNFWYRNLNMFEKTLGDEAVDWTSTFKLSLWEEISTIQFVAFAESDKML